MSMQTAFNVALLVTYLSSSSCCQDMQRYAMPADLSRQRMRKDRNFLSNGLSLSHGL
jgi:hypothetical protein